MRTFFITDIHGDLEGLNLLLDKAEVVPDRDQLVFGGDMINRGKDSAGVVRRIKQLTEQYPHNVHAVMGNHEEMMADYLVRGDKLWLSHGGHETLKSFAAAFPDEAVRQEQMVWACSLPLYYENDRYIFTHAGLNPAQPLDKQERDILWMNEYDFYHQPGGSCWR